MMKMTSMVSPVSDTSPSSTTPKASPADSQATQLRLSRALEAIRLDSRDAADEYLEDSIARFGGE